MILAFNRQFRDVILDGSKIHTIREDPKRRWRSGNIIHMATGIRTKDYLCFDIKKCVSVQKVFMTKYSHSPMILISVDGTELFSEQERLEFALNDGFKDWDSFVEWFYPLIMRNKEKSFSGRVIHWTDKKY